MDEKSGKGDLGRFFSERYRKLVGYFQASYADLSAMEAEDIVSDLMADLLENTDILDRVENLSAYVYQSIRNKANDYLRRRKKTVSLEGTVPGPDDADTRTVLEPRYDMTAELEAPEIRQRLVEALDALEPNQRAVWIATEIEGYTFAELAEAWGVPLGTLLARKHRANAGLQKKLQDLMDREPDKAKTAKRVSRSGI